jgi:hypothetical protein
MQPLQQDWLTRGLIDFEYKKYQLLAYLQQVNACFGRKELYPSLSDLIFHYRNLQSLKENKLFLRENFPKELSLDDLKALEVKYREMIQDDEMMCEIESIIEFALPQVKTSLDEGASIYEYVESSCELSPVGLIPLHAQAGYLFVSQPPQKEARVYRYQVTLFERSSESYKGLHTEFLEEASLSFSSTYEQIKLRLVRSRTDLPNPGAYLVYSKIRWPLAQTLLPVAKRLLMRHLSEAA